MNKIPFIQPLIALDQFVNTLVWAKKEGFGYADETLSARAWRLQNRTKTWGRFRKIVDRFFLVVFREKDHCLEAYISEFRKHQLPEYYRTDEQHEGKQNPQ